MEKSRILELKKVQLEVSSARTERVLRGVENQINRPRKITST